MKKILIYGGLVIAIILLLYFAVAFTLVQVTSANVAARRAAIEAAGDKVFLTDYQTEPIPDEENAYHYLMLAAGDLTTFDDAYSQLDIDFHRRLRPDQVTKLSALVKQHPQMYEHLQQAAACSKYRPNVDYSQGLAMLMPHLTHFRQAARALACKAVVQAYQGEGDQALAQCNTSLKLSSHVGAEPSLISHLVHLAAQGIAVDSANHTLRIAETSPEARNKLDATLDALDNRQAAIDAMKSERAMGMQTFDQLRSGALDAESTMDPALGPLSAVSRTWLGKAYLYDDEGRYIELLDLQIEAAAKERPEREDMMAPIEQELREGGFRHVLTRMLVPALDAAIGAGDKREAENRCLRVLMKLPGGDGESETDIEKLGLPAHAITDPFTGDPLLIDKVEGEWVVYSIGEDERDDGGDVFPGPDGESADLGVGPLGPALAPSADEVESDE